MTVHELCGVLHMEDGRQQLKKQFLDSDGGLSHKEEATLPVEAERLSFLLEM